MQWKFFDSLLSHTVMIPFLIMTAIWWSKLSWTPRIVEIFETRCLDSSKCPGKHMKLLNQRGCNFLLETHTSIPTFKTPKKSSNNYLSLSLGHLFAYFLSVNNFLRGVKGARIHLSVMFCNWKNHGTFHDLKLNKWTLNGARPYWTLCMDRLHSSRGIRIWWRFGQMPEYSLLKKLLGKPFRTY